MYVAIIGIGISGTRLLECQPLHRAPPCLEKHVSVEDAADILEWMGTFGYKRLDGDQNIIEFLITSEKEQALFLLKYK